MVFSLRLLSASNLVCLKRLYKQNKALDKIAGTKAPKVSTRCGKGRSKEQNVGVKNQYQTTKKVEIHFYPPEQNNCYKTKVVHFIPNRVIQVSTVTS